MCLSNTYIVLDISQNIAAYYIKYYFRATCFDSFESSSGPSRNRSKFINVYCAFWDPVGIPEYTVNIDKLG